MCATWVQRVDVCICIITAVMVGFHPLDSRGILIMKVCMGFQINRVFTIICNLPWLESLYWLKHGVIFKITNILVTLNWVMTICKTWNTYIIMNTFVRFIRLIINTVKVPITLIIVQHSQILSTNQTTLVNATMIIHSFIYSHYPPPYVHRFLAAVRVGWQWIQWSKSSLACDFVLLFSFCKAFLLWMASCPSLPVTVWADVPVRTVACLMRARSLVEIFTNFSGLCCSSGLWGCHWDLWGTNSIQGPLSSVLPPQVALLQVMHGGSPSTSNGSPWERGSVLHGKDDLEEGMPCCDLILHVENIRKLAHYPLWHGQLIIHYPFFPAGGW